MALLDSALIPDFSVRQDLAHTDPETLCLPLVFISVCGAKLYGHLSWATLGTLDT